MNDSTRLGANPWIARITTAVAALALDFTLDFLSGLGSEPEGYSLVSIAAARLHYLVQVPATSLAGLAFLWAPDGVILSFANVVRWFLLYVLLALLHRMVLAGIETRQRFSAR